MPNRLTETTRKFKTDASNKDRYIPAPHSGRPCRSHPGLSAERFRACSFSRINVTTTFLDPALFVQDPFHHRHHRRASVVDISHLTHPRRKADARTHCGTSRFPPWTLQPVMTMRVCQRVTWCSDTRGARIRVGCPDTRGVPGYASGGRGCTAGQRGVRGLPSASR